MPWLDRLGLSTCQVLCLGATIVEQKEPYPHIWMTSGRQLLTAKP